MKALLRVVLIVDALMLLGFGVLFLLTPWASLYDALQLVQPQPVLIGLVLGVVLLGLFWLAVRAAFDGAMTVPVGRVAGHINWISGALMLVWLIGLHSPELTGFGQLIAGGIGAWLIVIGFGGVRLAGAVRRREKAQAAQAKQVAGSAPVRRDPLLVTQNEVPGEPVTRSMPVFPEAASASATPASPPQSATQRTARDDEARDEAAGAPRPPLHG
jgi:predicted lipid-binding transport protein (Tim44 family)